MATDYDAPRKEQADEVERTEAELNAIKAASAKTVTVDDEANLNEGLELPGADLSEHALDVHVLPVQDDEFTCTRCFLVVHHTRQSATAGVCSDCD
jgi:hypothetical protein